MRKIYKKFLLFSAFFFLGFFLFFLNNQVVEATVCNNGPSNTNAGGCGTACRCGSAWTKYDKHVGGSGDRCEVYVEPQWYYITRIGQICSTADKCVSPSDNGLKWGNCDCSVGSLYKVCCRSDGSRAPCSQLNLDGRDPPEGVCSSGSTTVSGTSCPCNCSGWALGSCGASGCGSQQRPRIRSCSPSGCASEFDGCENSSSCCSCGGWSARGCGDADCGDLQRRYTRDCNPNGCQSESKCENDSSCCQCGSWSNGACGAAGGCPLGQRRQTRSCSPSGCSTESQCVVDSACNCACTWTDQDCGPTGSCALNRMYQTGVCNYPDCATTQCVVHPNCVSSCTISLSPSPLNVGLDKSRVLTATVVPQHATVNQVSFVSGDSNIASVDPASDSNSPYATAVYGRVLGATQITATTTLSPEGSCTAVVETTVRPTAWFQTTGGDIYTGASLSDDIPSTADDRNLSLELDDWPGIVTHQDENGVNLGDGFPSNDTSNHWLAESKYEGKAYGSFQFFKKKFATDLGGETYGGGRGDLPGEDGVYYAQSSRTLSGGWALGADRWVVLLVEGDVNINTNIVVPVGSFLAIAATGNINFAEDVTQAQGMFVADGTINTEESDQTFEGQGVFASGGFSLGRDFEDERNDSTPIETFIARPDFIMSSYQNTDYNLWWFFQKWQEIAP